MTAEFRTQLFPRSYRSWFQTLKPSESDLFKSEREKFAFDRSLGPSITHYSIELAYVLLRISGSIVEFEGWRFL